jgi:hypothetical protein
MNTDIQTFEHPRRLAREGAGHHERGAGRDAVNHRRQRRDIGGVADAEVVAVDDQEPVIGAIAQALGEGLVFSHGSASPFD